MAQQFSSSAQAWLQNKPITASSSGMSGFSPTANGWLIQKPTPQPTQTTKPLPQQKPIAQQSQPSGFESFLSKLTSYIPHFEAPEYSLKSPVPTKQMLPQAQNEQKKRSAIQFLGNTSAGILDTPHAAAQGATSLAQHSRQGNSTPGQVAGDIASIAMLPLMILSGGGASVAKEGFLQAAKQSGTKALVEVGKTISKEAIVGGAFGGLSGLESGRDITNPKDYIKNLLQNIGIGAAIGGGGGTVVHGTHLVAKDVVVPLAKGASAKMGAVFVKNATTNPEIVHMQLEPQVARSIVIGDEQLAKSSAGKEIIKDSVVAQEQGQHIGITPSDSGAFTTPGGEKVDISVVPAYKPKIENSRSIPDNSRKETGLSDTPVYHGTTAQGITELKPSKPSASELNGIYLTDNHGFARDFSKKNGIQINEPIKKYIHGKVYDVENLAVLKKTLGTDNVDEIPNILQKQGYDGVRYTGNTIGPDSREIIMFNNKTLKDTPHVEQQPLSDTNKVTKSFDAKGMEIPEKGNKKLLTGNEVKAIRDVITAKLEHLRNTSHSEESYGKGIDSLVADVTEKSQGDKQVLSALRTELNQEMYGIVGKSGNYKQDYATLQNLMKDQSGMGALLNKLDDHVRNLDEKLLSTPDKPKEAPAFVKEKAKQQTGEPTNQQPVGEGKVRDSAAYKRLVEHLQDKSPEELAKLDGTELKYHQMKIADQAEKALEFTQKDPQRAYRVAKGYENPPEGMNQHAVNMALADRAMAEKNYALAADLHKSGSLALTRAGQEIVMERGRYSDTSPHAFMRQLIKTRIQRLGNITETIKQGETSVKNSIDSAKGRAMAKIDKEVDKLKETMTKEQRKIKVAQDIINQLVCK